MTGRVLVPVLLDLTGLRVLFVGAGEGTRVKLSSLVDQDPAVRIVAPEVSDAVATLVRGLSDAQVERRAFEERDLDGVWLVYCMTDQPGVNTRVADLCRSRGLWSNVAHHRGPGAFSSPAVGRRDGLVAAFSTENATPSAAVAARDAWRGKS